MLNTKNQMVPDRNVLEAAATWFVQLRNPLAGENPALSQAGLERWLAESEAHRRAWSMVQQLEANLGQLPSGPSLSALAAIGGRKAQRRSVLKGLVVLAAAGGAGWLSVETSPWRAWVADYSIGPGERRSVRLADGGLLELNTETALDVRYDAAQRLIRLVAGEILVETAADKAPPEVSAHAFMPRPFIVETPHGRIRALGTRFSVRSIGDITRVAVFEHAVEIRPYASERSLRIEAGQQIDFSSADTAEVRLADRNQAAWTRGMLVVVDWRMEDFLKELSRYQHGRIACDPAVADLRVTGAYRVDDVGNVLDSLALSHPVQINRFTRLWSRVTPRA